MSDDLDLGLVEWLIKSSTASQVISGLPSGFNSGTTTKPTYTQTSIENPPSSGIYDHYISLTGGKVNLFDNATFVGYPKEYDIIDRNIQLVKGPINYICAKLNGDGTVTYENYTDKSVVNYSNIFPIYTFTADDGQNDFTPVDWDSPGYGLSNKLLWRQVETDRFERVSGFNLSEHGTRNITLSEGVLYQGVYRNTLPEIDSATYPLAFRYTDAGGNWLLSNVNSYPNTQYDNGHGLATLTDGRYAVLWLLRNISRNHIDVFLGNGDYTIDQAKASNLPNNIPEKFFATSFLVGRLIVLKGAATATTIDSAWVTKFSGSITSDHNSLTGKQGGATDAYYHSNQAINTTDSPTFAGATLNGNPTATTQAVDNNSTRIATTAFVLGQTSATAPAMDGTAATGSSTRFARSDHVHPTDTSRAPLASPAFTGDPTATTQVADNSSTRIATTAFVLGQAGTTSPVMDGTATAGTSTRFAKADHVHPTDTSRAPLASPTLTGTPTAPTASADTNTTQLATTAFVLGQASSAVPLVDGTATAGTSKKYAREDHVHPKPFTDNASSGYFDIGSMRIQWGSSLGSGTDYCNVNFPAAFANANYSITATMNSNGDATFTVNIYGQSTTGFACRKRYSNGGSTGAATSETFNYVAIGLKP